MTDQPTPTAERADQPRCWDLVVQDINRTVMRSSESWRRELAVKVLADIKKRDEVGRARYGTPLQPFNGRSFDRDAYEEALDLVVYLRGGLYEASKREGGITETVHIQLFYESMLFQLGILREALDRTEARRRW